MALANKAANVAKYDLGGTGDNIVPDGFIKTVEKVWIDTYTLSATQTLGTGSIVDIAKIPKGKKITGIHVVLPAAIRGVVTIMTTSTISLGARYGSAAVTNATQFLASTTLGNITFANMPISANTNIGVEVTGSTHTIFAQFSTVATAITGGTITTIVKYT